MGEPGGRSVDASAIASNVARIRAGIEGACLRVRRDPAGVRLIGASKHVHADRVRAAFDAGVVDFGENYVKELAGKAAALPDATWHFIGLLQSHTAHRVAELADVVQTVASQRSTERLAGRASDRDRVIDVLIEVDVAGARGGLAPSAVARLADRIEELEGVRLVGLMTLPPMPGHAEDSRPHFQGLRELLESLREGHGDARELSMGMSIDYEVAVEEGATMVRIGTALFGERPPAPSAPASGQDAAT